MEKEQLISLVTKAQQGDSTATNELFNAFYNDLYYFALKTIKDDDLALDITQEAFVEIINTLGNLKEPAAFVTWAKQITYHQCTRYFKKKKDVLVEEDEDGGSIFDDIKEENAEFIPDEALDKTDFKNTIMAILDQLSEEQRSAVMMYYFDEISVSKIAEIQGVSDGTVKSRLNYARKAIKNSVEEYEKKNNVKLHSLGMLPLFKWIFKGNFTGGLSASSAATVAEGVTAATGTTVAVSSTTVATTAVTTATTTTAVGIGAKIAAIPLATKIIAATVAAAVTIGGATTAVILSDDKTAPQPTDTQSIVESVEDTTSQDEVVIETTDELVLEGIIPDGCTYTLADGTVLTAGQPFPENCTAGDHVAYGDYLYGYECIYMGLEEDAETEWYNWADGFDSGDSGLIESDAFDAWSVMVNDRTKTTYGEVAAKINGKPIKTLYATYYFCANMTEAPKIPSTITAMTATYYGCSSLTVSPVIPSNVERMMITFRYCTALSGDVEINATLDKSLEWYYSDTFGETTGNINLVGSTPEEDLILIAKASNNRNITVNGKRVNYDKYAEIHDGENISKPDDSSDENDTNDQPPSDEIQKIYVEDVEIIPTEWTYESLKAELADYIIQNPALAFIGDPAEGTPMITEYYFLDDFAKYSVLGYSTLGNGYHGLDAKWLTPNADCIDDNNEELSELYMIYRFNYRSPDYIKKALTRDYETIKRFTGGKINRVSVSKASDSNDIFESIKDYDSFEEIPPEALENFYNGNSTRISFFADNISFYFETYNCDGELIFELSFDLFF